IVHLDRNVNGEFAVGTAEDAPETFVEVQLLCCDIEACRLGHPWVSFLVQGDSSGGGHLISGQNGNFIRKDAVLGALPPPSHLLLRQMGDSMPRNEGEAR